VARATAAAETRPSRSGKRRSVSCEANWTALRDIGFVSGRPAGEKSVSEATRPGSSAAAISAIAPPIEWPPR
jgi:hypothetical protein